MTLEELLLGEGPFVAYARGGALRGTYCYFARMDDVGLWDVQFSPPFVDDRGMVDSATLSPAAIGPGSTSSLFAEADLTIAPEELTPRVFSQLFRESILRVQDNGPAGPYVNARTLASHVGAAIERANPLLLENANLPTETDRLVARIVGAEESLQLVIDLLETLGLRINVTDVRHDTAEPWRQFD